jgi:hypothetical protein
MKESDTIGYDDIVAMTQEEVQNEEVTVERAEYDPFAQFENWVMGLGEASAITSEDPDEQTAALQSLQELVSQAFPAGVDGTNAIESLKGIIEDPELYKRIKDMSAEDPEADVREQLQGWLQLNAPEVLEQLDFGDMGAEAPVEEPAAEVPAEEPAAEVPAEEPVVQSDDNEQGRESQGSMNVQELAEFITSFYDKESGTFPKGPEGVAIMVGKKFGEQAESVARKFVERMAPQQAMEQNSELARIKELSGM